MPGTLHPCYLFPTLSALSLSRERSHLLSSSLTGYLQGSATYKWIHIFFLCAISLPVSSTELQIALPIRYHRDLRHTPKPKPRTFLPMFIMPTSYLPVCLSYQLLQSHHCSWAVCGENCISASEL